MADRRKLSSIIGAAGVARTENARARRVGVVFELPMLVAALGMLLRWWGEATNVDVIHDSRYFDIFLWSLFVVESVLLSIVVTNTRRYLRENWLNLVIIAMGVTLFWGWDLQVAALRLLRGLIVASLFAQALNRVAKMLSQNQLVPTLIASAIVIALAGVTIAVLEPGIKSPLDGIWWAWVTVTTVGYGDIVPVTPQGRIFGGLVILMGIALFAMITASFAAYFIGLKEQEAIDDEREEYRKLCALEDRLFQIEATLNEVREGLEKLRK